MVEESNPDAPSIDEPAEDHSIPEPDVIEETNETSETAEEVRENPPEPIQDARADPPPPQKPIKLYKSTRLKGYMTLTLASFINYDAARNSAAVETNRTVVPSTESQRVYAQTTSMVSLLVALVCLLLHLDRVTPLQKSVWIPLFRNGSRYEGVLIVLMIFWWSIATGVETSVTGIAGDGKGQYSLYYSTWACCLTSFWMLERWCVASGWSSFNAFITSWPNRSPAWICIMILSFFTMIWYLDLWQNHTKLDREPEDFYIRKHFDGVNEGQWQWLMIVTVFTFCPAVFFVLIELFRETKADGSTAVKSNLEAFIEGLWLLGLTFAWIATVMIATTPQGAASLIGNSYFFTWSMSIFVFEAFIWFIHDKRKATYDALKEKHDEYLQRQRKNLAHATELQRKHDERDHAVLTDPLPESPTRPRMRSRGFSSENMDGDEPH